ncbi:MAG: hypothetical protein LH619_03765 [Chitinophagaceae bacterium]|nr:hypothetical protein [Chitinophagaceae bacterium]
MGTVKKIRTIAQWDVLDAKIEKGLKKTATKLIGEKKRNNGLLIVADKNGKVKKIRASEF